MKKIEIAVALSLVGAVVNSGVGPSAYAEGSCCEDVSIKLSCPIPESEQLHDHGEKDTDSGRAVIGTAAILEGADVGAISGTAGIELGGTANLTATPAAS